MLILASESRTRQALLRQAGLDFEIESAAIDERKVETQIKSDGGKAEDVALGLAAAKAHAVSDQHPSAWVIGADQTLALGEEILHKPTDLAGASRQLDRLAGRTHLLHSAVALAQNGEIVWSKLVNARLTMRKFTPAERTKVLELEGKAALSSVGGYRLEGPSVRLFEKIEGDYFAILGLPLLELLSALRHHAPESLGETP
ncbi:MAG: Maf family protein [Cucumibacter sp.]